MYNQQTVVRKLLFPKTCNTRIQLFRSVFASSLSFAADFGLMTFLVEICSLYYVAASVSGFLLGSALNYLLAVRWIFPQRCIKSRKIEFLLFLAIGGAGVVLNSIFIYLLTEFAGIFYMISKVISASAVFFINFFMKKKFLFS